MSAAFRSKCKRVVPLVNMLRRDECDECDECDERDERDVDILS